MPLMMQTYSLSEDEVLLVRGPAAVKAGNGVSVLGAPIIPSSRVVVKRNKVLPFETSQGGSSLQVTFGEGGDAKVLHGGVGTKIWSEVAKGVLVDGRKVMIMGKTDAGKSTLTTYLINRALLQNVKPAIIDGDIGQSDLAPPGCVGASVVKDYTCDLRDVEADFFGFVGFTSPRWAPHLVIRRMREALDRLEGKYDLCIINTDGYVADEGMEYKARMMNDVGPDLVLVFRGCEDLSERLREVSSPPRMMPVEGPEGIGKSPSERNERRLHQYLRFLKGAKQLEVDLRRVNLAFMGDVYGEMAEGEDPSTALIMKKAGLKVLAIIGESGDFVEVDDGITSFPLQSFRGMFVGLGQNGSILGFGQILRLYRSMTLSLRSPLRVPFDTLFLSGIRLSPDLQSEAVLPVIRSKHPC